MTFSIQEETIPSIFQKPHLSYSRINRYLTCPEQYRLYYLENYRPKQPSASLIFGKVIHQAIARFFQTDCDLRNTFQSEWHEYKNANLRYSFRDTWDSLNDKGINLIGKFLDERLVRFSKIIDIEKEFELSIPGLNLPFVGIIDLIVEIENKITIVDFKTSSQAYPDYEADLTDQLTAYALAEPSGELFLLAVLVKTKEPRIDWLYSYRDGHQMKEYLEKVKLVAQKIKDKEFYKRKGMWCGMCDYLPLCLGHKSRIEETLVRIL